MSEPRRVEGAEEIWRRWDAMEARLSAPLSERMIELAGLRSGMRVLDLATGRGEPAIPAARRASPGGSVVGVDPAGAMLTMARERADGEGVANLELHAMDAADVKQLPGADFDAVLCRWGLMYMAAPVKALAGAAARMKPGAPIVVAVWAEPERVPYYSLPRQLLEKYRAVPPIDFSVPGVFHYADQNRLRGDLKKAGLEIELTEDVDAPVMEVETAADLIAWVRAFGLTRLLNGLPESSQQAWEHELVAAVRALSQDGLYRLGGVTRIVVARHR